MLKLNLYLYDSSQEENGYRGQDFSKYVLQGQDIVEDITQELDTAEITLAGLPFQEEFEPETQFIADIVETENEETFIRETIHLCVSKDISSQPILSDNNYFDHHISFIEPSVVAQKRLVDNISATYKLKDVTLKELPAFPNTIRDFSLTPFIYNPPLAFKSSKTVGFFETWYEYISGKYFEQEGDLIISNSQGQTFDRIYENIENFNNGDNTYSANFTFPKIKIYLGNIGSKSYSFVGYASISYKIEEFDLNDELNPTNVYTGNIISNSNLGNETTLNVDGTTYTWKNKINGEWLYENTTFENIDAYGKGFPRMYYKKYTNKNAPTPNYKIENIPLQVDKIYKVSISLYQFPDNVPSGLGYLSFGKFTGSQPFYYSRVYASYLNSKYVGESRPIEQSNLKFNSLQTSATSELITYSVESGSIVLSSSTPYSALALLQKAIINSSIYEKQDGVYIADVNNSNLPFYIDDDFVDELRATLIIENFYNQKNLWEIMIEVGNYIHAIPEIKFGKDNRFMITFNRLGRTDEKTDYATKISIFNSRSVEDYISATSSYVSNMVQLGGLIEEQIVPKTTNEQYVISNDTAQLITTKPIIELLEIKATRLSDGVTADITPFIYEENVYKTLSLDFQVEPNRGIAMYYKLGTNIITGGQYQLPQANTNIYTDYAFKKILYSAFNGYPAISPQPTTGYWETIKVSDYIFSIKYRTKDDVRQNHIRPDIRKYLLNSKHDKYPQHNQFNNQTDVVVDSVKFGNNMYGKLIRTGNNTYQIIEWADTYTKLKHKGELYRINGELYYVAKVKHTFYSSYIISDVTYSKDYNELSKIIGIPSEPRFYEISEQSQILRDFAINDLLLITDNDEQIQYNTNNVLTFDHLADLMFATGTDFAKFAITVFKGDKDVTKYDQTVGSADFYKEIFTPINAYSSEGTLTYEWDMVDNFSAGDKVVNIDADTEKPINEQAYTSLRAVQYTDIFGKSALVDFYVLGNIENLDVEDIKAFPDSPISTKQDDVSRPFVSNYNILATNVKTLDTNYNGRGLGLLKDCREAISMNYNLQLATNSDTFVISPYIFLPKKQNIKIVLLAEEVNKLSNGYIDNSHILTPIDIDGNEMSPFFDVDITKNTQQSSWDSSKNIVDSFTINIENIFANVSPQHFIDGSGYPRIKGIAIMCDVSLDTGLESGVSTLPYKTQFIIARNIPSFWDKNTAFKSWHIGSPNKNTLFTKKQ